MVRITAITLAATDGRTTPLRSARALRGFTQRDLERLADLPATTLSHIECGRRTLSPSAARRVATALDADVEALRL